MKYSKAELRRAVRLERMELQQELISITKRLRQIEDRMGDLTKAENLLEGDD